MKIRNVAAGVLAAGLGVSLFSPPAWSAAGVPANAIKSSQHYRTSGVGNATGRAGNATMTARALLGKDGSTLVEVSTGNLDSDTAPPGSFTKVQFKPLGAAGAALFAKNFTPPASAGGYYSFNWPSLHRAQKIQLQGNIKGIDRNRTGVVTVVETTKLRPDLAANTLTFPPSALINSPVNISANIVELNGDASATTTCVLAIDGTNVDQAGGVYVDAGGSVSCAFVHTFASAGSHTIQVTLANVVPGDWDTGNNAAADSITIAAPGTVAEHGYAEFSDQTGGFPMVTTSSWKLWQNGNLVENLSTTSGDSGRQQSSYASFFSEGCAGNTNAALWQFPMDVTHAETMDGVAVFSSTVTGISGYVSGGPVSNGICDATVTSHKRQWGYFNLAEHTGYFQALEYFDSAANLVYAYRYIESRRNAGDVTYFSSGYQCFYWSGPDYCDNPAANYYAWNSAGHNPYGTLVPVGSTWVPSVTTHDAGGKVFSGSVSVPLTSYQNTYTEPLTCDGDGPDSYGNGYQNCLSAHVDSVDTFGSAAF